MVYRATLVSQEPLNYFLQTSDEGPFLRVSDVVLRADQDPHAIFSSLIRLATNSQWSHSALLYLISDPPQGFDNTFLVEAMTSGVRVASWRNEVVPFDMFNVGIKRLKLDWYVETPKEQAQHDPSDPEDIPGIAYLRHARGMALDQINTLYDHQAVNELTALYIEQISKTHLPHFPFIADAAEKAANLFKKWDESSNSQSIMRFICSGLVQYAFFAALRTRIINDLLIPAHRDAAMSNLSNLARVIIRDDPNQVVPAYVRQVQSGKLQLSDPIPDDVLSLLKTTTPAEINNSPNLDWRYIVRKGVVWKINTDPQASTLAPGTDEADVLAMLEPHIQQTQQRH